MKLLLTQNIPYAPVLGGANKVNRAIMEQLAERGHEIEVVVPMLGVPTRYDEKSFITLLREHGTDVEDWGTDIIRFRIRNVSIYAAREPSSLRRLLVDRLGAFQPDVSIVASEDPSQMLLETALAHPAPVLYHVQTPAFLPFGRHAFFPSARRSGLVERCAAIVSCSHYVREYISETSGLRATCVYASAYGTGPFPDLGRFGDGYVTLVNPCAIKGISVFLELARLRPDVRFAAVPTWGTTSADLAELGKRSNVTVLQPNEDFDKILAQTSILLVPSLWREAFGLVIVEAMLRGIPVIASDVGGTREAKLGTRYLIPIRAVEVYEDQLDLNSVSIPVVPVQNLDAWLNALDELSSDRANYERESKQSRAVASQFVLDNSAQPFEALLKQVHEGTGLSPGRLKVQSAASVPNQLQNLTPEQRALFALRLKKKAATTGFRLSIPRIARKPSDELPISANQVRALWLHETGNPIRQIAGAMMLEGPLDRSAFSLAIERVWHRHEVLQVRFEKEGGRWRQILPLEPKLNFSMSTTDAQSSSARLDTLKSVMESMSVEPPEPPWCVRLVIFDSATAALCIAVSHTVADAASVSIFLGEIGTIYGSLIDGTEPALPAILFSYADFAVWQRNFLETPAGDREVEYWRKLLDGAKPIHLRGRHEGVESPVVAAVPGLVHGHLALGGLCASTRSSLFLFASATLFATLFVESGLDDIAFNSSHANRSIAGTENMIGFFTSPQIQRQLVSGFTIFADLLDRVKAQVLASRDNSHIDLITAIPTVREILSSFNFAYVAMAKDIIDIRGLRCSNPDFDLGGADVTTIPLVVHSVEKENGVDFTVVYHPALYSQARIEQFVSTWQIISSCAESNSSLTLQELAAHASRLDFAS